MEIRNTTAAPSFGAKYLSSATVQKKLFLRSKYRPQPANFVRLSNNENDIESLFTFSRNYSNSCLGMLIADGLQTSKNYQVYALTRQKKGFDKLEPDKILGICGGSLNATEGGNPWFYISHLEAKSTHNPMVRLPEEQVKILGIPFNIRQKYKGIGSELLKKILTQLLEQQENLSCITLKSMEHSKSFYKHLGWEQGYPMDERGLTPFRLTRRHFDSFLSGDSVYPHA